MQTETQNQTADTFGYKWKKRETFESDAFQKTCQSWLKERYDSPTLPLASLVRGKRLLDAGCGAGHAAVLLFGDLINEMNYVGVDISSAVDVARERFKEKNLKGQFVQTSLTDLPKEMGNFDIIFSEGVLHHTDSTSASFDYLCNRLNPNGIMMIYVYKKKAPLREFADDHIRASLAPLSHDEAWRALEPLSELGKTLGDLDIEIEIKKPVDMLGIPAGKINLQRFFYWYFCKAFYRPDFSLDEMNHINFDWYRPLNCHRHSEDEVRSWAEKNKLAVLKLKTEDAGITLMAQKTSF